ncbi:MAG TPA: hypothetical protein VFW79_02430 [Cellulomonas sp.]|uniref:hypothetical protein n=1 Tax=Cellulomonas sp. TaxID=40001 RepID=UPI002E33A151|nr:hypothetical protein [Cellulomonas sp.]HEX5331478.1 hypothetical protein [Cellulomonas sp.]
MPPMISMRFDVDGPLLDSARDCEAEVFRTVYGNTREQLESEYGPYEDNSVFLALALADTVVGAVRMIRPGGQAGLKTLADIEQGPWSVDGSRSAAAAGIDLESTWEIATLGVRRGTSAAGQRLSMALYHGLIAVARANAMTSFVAILDERVRRMLASVGIITRPLPGTSTAPYLGSAASTPVYAHCGPLLDHQRREFPDAYRLVTLGVGLDGVAVPALDAFRVGSRAPRRTPADFVPLGAIPLSAAALVRP